MKFWKDKDGNKLTYSEFLARWKDGIMSITPLQQIKTQTRSTLIMLVGVLAGIIVTITQVKKLWWVLIILIGAFGVILMQFIGLAQKKKFLENIERGLIEND